MTISSWFVRVPLVTGLAAVIPLRRAFAHCPDGCPAVYAE
jgi:hypothetical protein